MSTRARKERKRAGIPFVKPAKVGTPPLLRSTMYFRLGAPVRPWGPWLSTRTQQRRAKRAGWVHEEKGEERK